MPGDVRQSEVEPLVKAQAVADFLGINVQTLYNWRAAGEGPPCVKLGGRAIRYRMSDVTAWLAAENAA